MKHRAELTVIALVVILLVAIGAWRLTVAGFMVVGAVRAADWTLVHGKVLDAQLRHTIGGKRPGYLATGTYGYEFGGRAYTGRQLGLTPPDTRDLGFEEWHLRMSAKLEDAKARGAIIPIYVNPANPGESIHDRRMRFGLLALESGLGLLAMGAGIAVGFASRMYRRGPR